MERESEALFATARIVGLRVIGTSPRNDLDCSRICSAPFEVIKRIEQGFIKPNQYTKLQSLCQEENFIENYPFE